MMYYTLGEGLIAEEASGKEDISLSWVDFFLAGFGLNSTESKPVKEDIEDEILAFVRIPFQIETTIGLGFLCCLDCFLFLLTFLPLRFLYSIFERVLRFRHTSDYIFYDAMRLGITLVAYLFLEQLSVSHLYHFLRTQSFIKLFVVFNMLDIVERLFCSLGHDVNESLLALSRRRFKFDSSSVFKSCLRLFIAAVYNTLHSFIFFCRLVVLSAAINSESKALLSLLLSNNFIEIKSSVFKRFGEANLFQISCADIVERFELIVFLCLIVLNLETVSFSYFRDNFLGSFALMLACEAIVDWIKHMFIIRFNNLPNDVYKYYQEMLFKDLMAIFVAKNEMTLHEEPSLAVARRIGLAPLPLLCITLRFSIKYLASQGLLSVYVVGYIFINFLLLRTVLSLWLRGKASTYLSEQENKIVNRITELGKSSLAAKNFEDHQKRIDILSKVKRYMLFSSRIPH